MKIGYVHSVPFPSVDANVLQVVQMCRAFAQCGHDVTLFIPRAEKFLTNDEALAAAREIYAGDLPFQIEFVPSFKLCERFAVLGTVKGTLIALRKHKPDLVYSRNPWSVVFLPRAGIPFVFEAHEEKIHMRSRLLDRFLRSVIVRRSRQPLCAKVVTISDALRKTWEEFGVPSAKLFAAHDGVEISMFNPRADKTDARRRLNLPRIKPLVVYTGALKSDRGVDVMLEAARQIPEIELCLVGGKDDEISFWKNEAQRLGITNVRFAGKVPHKEIPLFLAAADVLLMMWTWRVPTIRGCSPMKMFEYMAAGRLIVGPAFPTIKEVLEHGRDSILFEPDDCDALIAALREALVIRSDPTLPHTARAKVEREYTWRVRAQKILAEIR